MRTSRRWMVPTGLLIAMAAAGPLRAQFLAPGAAVFDVNRVQCGLRPEGHICVDHTGSTVITTAYWPKGTVNNYSFNSGLQLAGIIDPGDPSSPWAGDTAGGYFFDSKGTTEHGEPLQDILDAAIPENLGSWPDAARVPTAGPAAELFVPSLRGRASASEGDLWWLSWEGNPRRNAGRPHPLGVVAEHRVMGWNYPEGNEDVMYVLYTLTNITSLNEADYSGIEPGMRALLLQQARAFHELADAELGVDLPDDGYTITSFFAGIGTDFDVGDAGENYSGVHLPFAMGNTYQANFVAPSSWSLDPGIHAEPFELGVGFIGVKLLGGSDGRGAVHLFTNIAGGGTFGDSRNVSQLWRYLSGGISPAAGDANCDHGPPPVTRLCYINNSLPRDSRFVQSSALPDLLPGQQVTLAVAYVFAAPVSVASYVPGGEVTPGDPLRFADPAQLASIGANLADSIAGFLGYSDVNGDGIAQQDEYLVQPRSFLDKALVAQRLFDNKFVLPVAPEPPEFHLIPGSNQVTIVWRPSPSEETGDPYFELASTATVVPPHGGPPVPNVLYDPNFRQFDVQGYRIYRGRTSDPKSMKLLASFDYSGTSMRDYSGTIGHDVMSGSLVQCAPELGYFTGCEVDYIPAEFQPGVERTVWAEIPLDRAIIQVRGGDRFLASRGEPVVLRADTLNAGLGGNGVPFIYEDKTVRNSFRYFYSVVAFDVNSYASGPSSQESVRIVKEVTPRPPATDREYAVSVTQAVYGRGMELSDTVVPTIDPVKGTFSKPFPPANGWAAEFTGYVPELMSGSQQVTMRLDSIRLGSAYNNVPGTYFVTINAGRASAAPASFALAMPNTGGFRATSSLRIQAAAVDPARAAAYGVDPALELATQLEATMPGDYWVTVQSRGCFNGAEGFTNADGANECSYNGSRWFDGDVETAAHPTAGNLEVNNFGFSADDISSYNNAGKLAGVTTIYEARSYATTQSTWRNVEAIIGFAARAADIKVYWGGGGVVDSVIDVTHNVVVPFDTAAGGSWGFVDPSAPSTDARPAVASLFDFGCVYPINQFSTLINCGGQANLKPVATLDQVVMVGGSPLSAAAVRAPQPNPGFVMYIAGHVFTFEMPALPADGTVWTMRAYTGGGLTGGQGSAGDEGPYVYNEVRPRPFTAVGAELRLTINATNSKRPSTLADLDRIHTVPDPYYVSSAFEQTVDENALRFVNLPSAAVIRIYSSSGVLVDVIEHNSATSGGSASWDVRSREGELVASGVYFYHIESGDARRVGRFTIVRAS